MPPDELRELTDNIKYLKDRMDSVYLGMYGDEANKMPGLIANVKCLLDYKPELKWLRKIRDNLWKIVIAIFTGVSISVISGYLIWTYIRR